MSATQVSSIGSSIVFCSAQLQKFVSDGLHRFAQPLHIDDYIAESGIVLAGVIRELLQDDVWERQPLCHSQECSAKVVNGERTADSLSKTPNDMIGVN